MPGVRGGWLTEGEFGAETRSGGGERVEGAYRGRPWAEAEGRHYFEEKEGRLVSCGELYMSSESTKYKF